jgi:hypothetical protein
MTLGKKIGQLPTSGEATAGAAGSSNVAKNTEGRQRGWFIQYQITQK